MTEQQAADAYCRVLATRHYENFAVASRFVPPRIRLDLMRFYAFCRTTDDFGDESGTRHEALARLSRWREQAEEFFSGAPPVHPVFIALRETVERYGLDKQPFLDLIAANEQDQHVQAYRNWPQLRAYCMLSAAPVGRVVLRFFGMANPVAESLSDDVCIGLQLANHAQDVGRDAALGRRYLLQDDVEAGGIVVAVRSLVERARTLLASGEALERMAPAALRFQLALYRLGGLSICSAIEGIGYRTDVRRPVVSKRTKMRILMQAAVAAAGRAAQVNDATTA
ncbi:MAG TPA: squalene/phytoene synthase family protein [Candidatus Baltobacteraceae bacterium]|jgi:squalene synthase HpnC|nr:squalene/phytoene synthase family protein [Candidatus Baltobacteraceae bacterium]